MNITVNVDINLPEDTIAVENSIITPEILNQLAKRNVLMDSIRVKGRFVYGERVNIPNDETSKWVRANVEY